MDPFIHDTGNTVFVRNETRFSPSDSKGRILFSRLIVMFISFLGAMEILFGGIINPAGLPLKPRVIFFVAGGIFLLFGLAAFFLTSRVYQKNAVYNGGLRIEYLCDEAGVTQIFYDGETERGRMRIFYPEIVQVRQRKNYLLLFYTMYAMRAQQYAHDLFLYNNMQSMPIAKNGYTLGSEAELLARINAAKRR